LLLFWSDWLGQTNFLARMYEEAIKEVFFVYVEALRLASEETPE
jgi:hypothetical protein